MQPNCRLPLKWRATKVYASKKKIPVSRIKRNMYYIVDELNIYYLYPCYSGVSMPLYDLRLPAVPSKCLGSLEYAARDSHCYRIFR